MCWFYRKTSSKTCWKQKLKQKAGVEVRWNHRLADLEMKNCAATATIDELAMEDKGCSVPDFEMAVKKTVSINADFVVGADGHGDHRQDGA